MVSIPLGYRDTARFYGLALKRIVEPAGEWHQVRNGNI